MFKNIKFYKQPSDIKLHSLIYLNSSLNKYTTHKKKKQRSLFARLFDLFYEVETRAVNMYLIL